MPIDHAGIATTDADALLAQYGALFDVDVAHEETFDDGGRRKHRNAVRSAARPPSRTSRGFHAVCGCWRGSPS
jgi:hypothetical protein